MRPLRIASFDIECNSFDGEFPLAQRDYAKVLRTFIESKHPNAEEYFSELLRTRKIVPGRPVSLAGKDFSELDEDKLKKYHEAYLRNGEFPPYGDRFSAKTKAL